VFGLIEGQGYGWLTPKETFAIGSFTWPFSNVSITPVAFAIGILFMLAFVWYEVRLQRRGGDPLFDFTLLRFKGFRFGLLTVLVIALGEFGIIFVLSIYLQGVRGLSAFDTGLLFAGTTLVIAPLAGLLSARFGPKWVVTTGSVAEKVIRGARMPVLMVHPDGAGLDLFRL
jgi:hypothetical protein